MSYKGRYESSVLRAIKVSSGNRLPRTNGAATIRADGWTALVTIPNAVVGGTYNLGTDSAPTVSMTVTSKSWSTAGVETTISRTVYGKAALRKPYPNQATKDETVNGTGIDVHVVLNDYVYANETVSNITIGAGFHTDSGSGGSGLPSAAQLAAPTNNSTFAYRKPVAMWLNHDLDWVKANTYTVQMAVAHKDFRNGLPVRCVKFIATDLHSNTSSVIASTMVKRDFSVTGLSAPVFSGNLDFSSLTQGDLVTIDAIIYPWVGDAFQVSVDGDTYPSQNLTIFKVLNDRTGAYGTSYAYVNAVGGGTPQVSTNPVTAAANPYSTIALAAAAIQAFNNSTFTRNNVSGGIIRLTATTHVHSTYSARAVGVIPLIIEAADAANKATTIYQDAGASVGNGVCDWLKLRNIKLRQTGNYLFLNMGGTKTSNHGLIFDSCTFDRNGKVKDGSWITDTGRTWVINCDGDDCSQATHYSTNAKAAICIGSAKGSLQSCAYSAIGCKDLSGYLNLNVFNAGNTAPAGSFYGWNFASRNDVAVNITNSTTDQPISDRGLALVGNCIETTATTGGGAVGVSGFDVSSISNFIDISNTIVGERSILLYNDAGSLGTHKDGVSSLSIHNEWNSKSDVFATNGAEIGNWSFIYRVGSKHRATLRGSSSADTFGVGSWLGEVSAKGDTTGTSGTPLVADFVNDASYIGSGLGNGDYTPGASTAVPQIPAGETAYPYDLLGRAIPTDGTAFVGAVQRAA